MTGRVLVIAGSDSGGGAGIQADIKTIQALGGYATTAITALTAQDTRGVHGVYPVPPGFVRQQAEIVLADIGADAVKTGMLGSAEVIGIVAGLLRDRGLPFVLDPVMVAKGGARLLDPAALGALRALIPFATLLTPNIPEAEALLGRVIGTHAEARQAARDLLGLGPRAVLLKGGHLDGPELHDVLAQGAELTVFSKPRIDSRHTHGTGCTLASAIAAGLALGGGLLESIARARDYVQAAIEAAPGIGAGHGPLGHLPPAFSGRGAWNARGG